MAITEVPTEVPSAIRLTDEARHWAMVVASGVGMPISYIFSALRIRDNIFQHFACLLEVGPDCLNVVIIHRQQSTEILEYFHPF